MNQFFRKFKKILILCPYSLWRRGLRFGVAASTEHLHIFRQEKFSTLIDAGANRGQFSLMMRALYPECRVYAFEPLQQAREIYNRIFSGFDELKLYPYALADKEAEVQLKVATKNDSSSLLEFSKVSEMFSSASFSHIEQVQAKRLDQVLKKSDLISPVLLKIDVQGYEREVLLGAENLIESIDAVYVEASFVELYANQVQFAELYELLLSKNFSLKRIGHISGSYSEPGTYGDFLFTRPIKNKMIKA